MGNHISGLRNLTSETGFFPVKLVYRHCYDAAEILPVRSVPYERCEYSS